MSEPDSDRHVLTPSTLNRLVRDLLGDALPQVWVEGELSNLARPASGHLYFTLKDPRAQIRCAMFRARAASVRFRPDTGMQVLVRASVGLYEARGDYQLIVEHMEEAGQGALQRQFEELKARLLAEGLFDVERKRPLPIFAQRIGVITSASGAAIRDVLNVLARRFPLVRVDVLPVPVQGKEAPAAIIAMLDKANRAARHDVLVLTRGGGSLEDLWAFNDEGVARAIHASDIPVLSAVGHEIDFSISDFVADMRAPTPSAAAELLVPDALDLLHRLQRQSTRLHVLLRQRLQAHAQHLDHVQTRLQLRSPQQRLQHGRERLQGLQRRLQQLMQRRLAQWRARTDPLRARLQRQHPRDRFLPMQRQRLQQARHGLVTQLRRQQQRREERLARFGQALHALSPLATLQRGYAIVFDAEGTVLHSAAAMAPGTPIRIQLTDGSVHAVTDATAGDKA